MSGLLPAKAKKKKRGSIDEQATLKRVKLENATNNGKALQFQNTLSPPIQEALSKFREASEQELIRLRSEGMDSSTAINKLVEKMRSSEGDDIPACFTRQELELVMEIAGVNEEGATRALILRSELTKLRQDGFNHPEAINELSRRMKRMAGSKRRGTSSVERRDGKHRRRGSLPTSPKVSFTHFDTLSTPQQQQLQLQHHHQQQQQLQQLQQLQQATATRKRIQDVLMMDDDQYNLLRKRPKYDLSDSEGSSEGEQYHFDDVGEFSQDDEKEGEGERFGGRRKREEGDSEDVNSPEDLLPLVPPFVDYSASSSSDDDGYQIFHYHKDNEMNMEGGDRAEDDEDISGFLFHPVKEEDEEGDNEEEDRRRDEEEAEEERGEDSDDSWPPATTTTTTTTTSTTSTTNPHTPSSNFTISPQFTPTPSLPTSTSSHTLPHSSTPSTHTRLPLPPKPIKRRDGPSPSPSSSSSRVLSHRSIS